MSEIVLVDGHVFYRRALRSALEALIAKSRVIEFDNLEAARVHFEPDGHLDLVLIDLSMPVDLSLKSIRSLHERYPKTRFAVMAALATRIDIVRSLEVGLYGFISKSQSDEEIFGAIKDILSDRIYVPLSLTHVEARDSHSFGQEKDTCLPQATSKSSVERLTRRQREVLPLLARGMSNKEIARVLKIAEGTMKIHASSLLRALGVRNRTEAAVVARALLETADQ
jgi:DNA-binding NarL/FixJ family response regulator